MTKNKFLLVDLNEKKIKKLANVITSDTSRKILSHLAEKDDTEAKIAEQLNVPISTVHYHLHKLQEAQLVLVEEFHYSKKGREVNHYKLANKYIIIAPKKISGLKQKLKDILPVGLIAIGVGVIAQFIASINKPVAFAQEAMPAMLENADLAVKAIEIVPESLPTSVATPGPLGFFLGGVVVTIIVYILYILIKEKIRNKK